MIGLRTLLSAIRDDEDGVTLVEFALIAVPLLLILFAGFDLAHRSYVDSVMQGALNIAAREASVEDPALSGTGTMEQRVADRIKAQVQPIAPNAKIVVTQKNYFEFSGVGNPEKITRDNDGDGTYDQTDGDCFEDLNANGAYDTDTGRSGRGGADDVVLYNAVLTMDEIVPLQSFLGGSDKVTVTADVAIRNQPWGTQAQPPVICGVIVP